MSARTEMRRGRVKKGMTGKPRTHVAGAEMSKVFVAGAARDEWQND